MKKTLITALTASIVLASASTYAFAAKDGGKRDGHRHGPSIERILERLDTNKDGGISLEEVKTAREEMFAKVDANSDSSLTEEEFNMIREIHKAERDANKPEGEQNAENKDRDGKRGKGDGKRAGKRGGKGMSFDRLDADDSGTVTLAEFTEHTEKMFERMDRNSDGVVNADDMKRKRK